MNFQPFGVDRTVGRKSKGKRAWQMHLLKMMAMHQSKWMWLVLRKRKRAKGKQQNLVVQVNLCRLLRMD